MGGRADPDERIAGADPPLQRLAAQMRLEPFPQKGRAAVMDRTQPGNGGGGIGERVGGNRVGDQDFRVARHLSRSSTPARRRSSLRLTPPQNLVRTDSRIRSEEHTSELQSLMRNSYAVFCLNKK